MRIFYEVRGVPSNSMLLIPTRAEAMGLTQAEVVLGFCGECGFISNTAYDPALTEYSDRYDSTQAFSGTYDSFSRELAKGLISRYGLSNRHISEIGCGNGEFLALICGMGNNSGTGFDPAFSEERSRFANNERITFIRDLYSDKYSDCIGDFMICKMTLEHIMDTGEFIKLLSRSLAGSPDTIVFFQVPDTSKILRELAFWDIYYEHCSYFTEDSLSGLFRRNGFEVLDRWKDYGGQYLFLTARLSGAASGLSLPEPGEAARWAVADIDLFAGRLDKKVLEWKREITEMNRIGLRVVVWGAGSKGVSFLTTLGIKDEIRYAVDINPSKHGKYMAGSGQEIVSPDFMEEYRPDVVIIMNPVYMDEIRRDLLQRGLAPSFLAV